MSVESPAAERPVLVLSDLLAFDAAELDALYARAPPPTADELDGRYDGLILTGALPRLTRPFALASVNRWLPWTGKSFSRNRRGANRFRLGHLAMERWPFSVRIGDSELQQGPTLRIEYDLPESPFYLRHKAFDELRRLRDGLYLGLGGLRLGGAHRFVFHWALARSD